LFFLCLLASPWVSAAEIPWAMMRHDAGHSGLSKLTLGTNPSVSPLFQYEEPTPFEDSSSSVTNLEGDMLITPDNILIFNEHHYPCNLIAFDPVNRTVLWRVFRGWGGVSPAISSDGVVYTYIPDKNDDSKGVPTGIDIKTGTIIWQETSFAPDFLSSGISSVMIDKDENIYFSIKDGLAVYKKNRTLLWKHQPSADASYLRNTFSIGPTGRVYIANDYGIYAISKDYNLYAKWLLQLNDQVEYQPNKISDPVISADGTLYVILIAADTSQTYAKGVHSYLFAIEDEGENGKILWKKEIGSAGTAANLKPVLGPTGLLYLVANANSESTVYCLDTSKSGDIKWSTNIGAPINGNMIMDANQILYMVAGSSAITDFIGVDGKSGTILPRLNYAGTPNGDMAIATDGKIYYSAYHYTQERNYYHTIMAVSSDISQNTTTTIPGGTTTTTIPSETTTTTIPIDQSCEIISIDPTDVSIGFGLLPRTRNIIVTLNTDLTALGITGDDLVFDAPRGVNVLSAEVSANIIQASVLFWGVQPGTYNVTIGACGSIPFIVKRF
jgi:outer membrane protein assembly factor BamB